VGIGIETAAFLFAGMGKGKFDMFWSRVVILAFRAAGGNELFHDLDKIDLEEFTAEVIYIVGTFLQDDRTGGVVGIDGDEAVLDTGVRDDLLHLFCDVVKTGHVIAGLQLDLFNNGLHLKDLHSFMVKGLDIRNIVPAFSSTHGLVPFLVIIYSVCYPVNGSYDIKPILFLIRKKNDYINNILICNSNLNRNII